MLSNIKQIKRESSFVSNYFNLIWISYVRERFNTNLGLGVRGEGPSFRRVWWGP